MTIAEMLNQSGQLTLMGMGMVFGFLIIMIIAVIMAGKCIHALGLDKDVAPAKIGSGTPAAGKSAGSANAAVTAAISAAVTEYRKK